MQGNIESSRVANMNMDDDSDMLSSENEEDRRHPHSIQAIFKRIVKEVLDTVPSKEESDVRELALSLHEMGISSLSPKMERQTLKQEASGPDDNHALPALTNQMQHMALSLTTPRKWKSGDGSSKDFACVHCGHVFSLLKTRNLHAKKCMSKG